MRFRQTVGTLALVLATCAAWSVSATAEAPTSPPQRVVATYFHRTVRCPTCQKVGSSPEQVIRRQFAAELLDGRLEWRMLDFQDRRNAGLVSAFRITGPTFALLVVRDDRVVAWKPAPGAWGLIGDEAAFARNVEAEVRSVLGVEATETR